MSELPDWALKHLPVKHTEAAMLLGVSERKLWDILGEHPHYERRGRANVYYPEHIEALRKVMSEAGERSHRRAEVAAVALERERRKERPVSDAVQEALRMDEEMRRKAQKH